MGTQPSHARLVQAELLGFRKRIRGGRWSAAVSFLAVFMNTSPSGGALWILKCEGLDSCTSSFQPVGGCHGGQTDNGQWKFHQRVMAEGKGVGRTRNILELALDPISKRGNYFSTYMPNAEQLEKAKIAQGSDLERCSRVFSGTGLPQIIGARDSTRNTRSLGSMSHPVPWISVPNTSPLSSLQLHIPASFHLQETESRSQQAPVKTHVSHIPTHKRGL